MKDWLKAALPSHAGRKSMWSVLWQDGSWSLWHPSINIHAPFCHTVSVAVSCHVLYVSARYGCVCLFSTLRTAHFYHFMDDSSSSACVVCVCMSQILSQSVHTVSGSVSEWGFGEGRKVFMHHRPSICLFCNNLAASLLATVRPPP